MSPDFFNLYGENVLRLLEESDDDVLINGTHINNIKYADDIVLIADNEEVLQRLMDLVVDASSDEGLEINNKKTYCMVISKDSQGLPISINFDFFKLTVRWFALNHSQTSSRSQFRDFTRISTFSAEVYSTVSSANSVTRQELRMLGRSSI